MTDHHDPLCSPDSLYGDDAEDEFCHCELAALIRADEQAKQPRVEIEAALGEPMTCRVWVNGSLVFTGIDLASAAHGTNEFPPHKHFGDMYDPYHCVYVRADGERCMEPLDRSSK